MTPWHVAVIFIAAALEGLAICKGATGGEVTAIVAAIIGAAAGNAQAARGQGRASDAPPESR